jgi:hypothetical protein
VSDAESPAAAAAERWFTGHGLPYFVDDVREEVRRGLARSRLALVAAAAAGLGAAAGTAVGLAAQRLDPGLFVGAQTAIVVLLLYALTTLRAWSVARWALRRTLRSLGQLFPLVTRALPLLLLFVTFLFINAEVWQVAASLNGSVMWLTVALFTAITVGFLLVRLPEELDVFDDELDNAAVLSGCRGTPLEPWAREHLAADGGLQAGDDRLAGLQKANLVLVLLIVQIVQVLLLALAVFVFFVAFGLLVMDADTIRSWTGESVHALPSLDRANTELLKVSVFLAAFSGLYFTVYAVTDEVYRKQFFTSIIRELERSVCARAAYRAMVRSQQAPGG